MFKDFEQTRITTQGAEINLVRGGAGAPILLLHGYPQTHAMWHPIAERLAEQFAVVCSDLRGYGDSSKPPGGEEHQAYSKRAMAQDQVEVMQQLGFDKFVVIGHDRGGRVGHRMALDYPDKVVKLAVLDIVPTHTIYATTNKELATAYYHWFFLIQPYDLPERLIGADPVYYLHKTLGGLGTSLAMFAPDALAEYERCFQNPATIRATCEDYRAAASIDLVHDENDLDKKITCPVLALWGEKGKMHKLYDVLETWRKWAQDVRGHAMPAGHFLVEEMPNQILLELLAFLKD